MRHIFLCGFMGCGKTTVGKALADLLGLPFADMDQLIEQRAGMTVREIFETRGESHFRMLESETAAAFSGMEPLVVSTGGGAVLNPANAEQFRRSGRIVCIDVPLEVIRRRLEGDTTRPLLNRPDRDEAMRSLFERRAPVYKSAADIVVKNADDRPARLIAEEIAKKLSALV